jgi:hypothetical protein
MLAGSAPPTTIGASSALEKFLWGGTCYQQLRITNYGLAPVAGSVDLHFAAAYADIFEPRGARRKARGEDLSAEVTADRVVLGYRGLDSVVRRTILAFSPAPTGLTASTASFPFCLRPRDEVVLRAAVACERASSAARLLRFEDARSESECEVGRYRAWSCHLGTSNGQVNAWVDRAASDLHMMTTDLSTGPYPYAGVPWLNTPFGRDGIITALECLWLRPSLARGVLGFLASTQATRLAPEEDAEPGKILHETRSGEMATLKEVPFGLRVLDTQTRRSILTRPNRTVRKPARVPGPPGRLVRARVDLPVADEVGELVQDQPGIRDRPGIPGMTGKRKPIRGLQPQPSPKRTMEDRDVPPLRSPSQARTRLAEWPLIVDQTPDDQAVQVQMTPRLATARTPIEDREPAPARQRTPDDRDLDDAYIRDGQLDGRPLLDGLHAKNAGQRAVVRRGPEDKVRPAARIRQRPGRREGGQARDIRAHDDRQAGHIPSRPTSSHEAQGAPADLPPGGPADGFDRTPVTAARPVSRELPGRAKRAAGWLGGLAP